MKNLDAFRLVLTVFFSLVGFGLLYFLPTTVLAQQFTTVQYIPEAYKNIGQPRGLTVLDDGSFWYIDRSQSRMLRVNSSGAIIRTIGRAGSEDGEFLYQPQDITRDGDGILHVLEVQGGDCRVSRFDSNGGFLDTWGSCTGGGDAQLSQPYGIHFDSSSSTFLIGDAGNTRVVRFSSTGVYQSHFGTAGDAAGQFQNVRGVTTDSAGKVYVVDEDTGSYPEATDQNSRVQRFTSEGVFEIEFGNSALTVDAGRLLNPKNVVVLANGNVVVTAQNAQKIHTFDDAGDHVLQWGENGGEPGQFGHPEYLAVDSTGDIWVSDWLRSSIQRFAPNGTYEFGFRNGETTAGLLFEPTAMVRDSTGRIYVLDDGGGSANGRVQRFSSTGVYETTLVQLENPDTAAYFMAIHNDELYISMQHRVRVYSLVDGTLQDTIGEEGSGNGQFLEARGIVFDGDGFMFVADLFNDRVQVFAPDGENWTHILNIAGDEGEATALFDEPESLAFANGYVFVADMNRVQYYQVATWNHGEEPVVVELGEEVLSEGGTGSSLGGVKALHVGGFWPANETLIVSQECSLRFYEVPSSVLYNYTLGSCGAGIDQFNDVRGAVIIPDEDGEIAEFWVADRLNHRAVRYALGVRIENVISSLDVLDDDASRSLVNQYWATTEPNLDSISSEMYFGDYIVSDFVVNLTTSRDWEAVNAITSPVSSKSLITNLDPDNAPGVSETHALYVLYDEAHIGVHVCPLAQSLSDITEDCADGYFVEEGDDGVQILDIGGTTYWRIGGLTGTGILGVQADEEEEEGGGGDPTPTPSPTGSSGSSSGLSTLFADSECHELRPGSAPDLFQIDRTGTSARLYITPSTNPYTKVFILYGSNQEADQHSDIQEVMNAEGVIVHEIHELDRHTAYTFKVQSVNHCQGGDWSNSLKIDRARNGTQKYFRVGLSKYVTGAWSVMDSVNPVATDSDELSDEELEAMPKPSPAPSPTTGSSTPQQQSESQDSSQSGWNIWGWIKGKLGW